MFRIILTIATILIVLGSVVSQQRKSTPSGFNEATLKALELSLRNSAVLCVSAVDFSESISPQRRRGPQSYAE